SKVTAWKGGRSSTTRHEVRGQALRTTEVVHGGKLLGCIGRDPGWRTGYPFAAGRRGPAEGPGPGPRPPLSHFFPASPPPCVPCPAEGPDPGPRPPLSDFSPGSAGRCFR